MAIGFIQKHFRATGALLGGVLLLFAGLSSVVFEGKASEHPSASYSGFLEPSDKIEVSGSSSLSRASTVGLGYAMEHPGVMVRLGTLSTTFRGTQKLRTIQVIAGEDGALTLFEQRLTGRMHILAPEKLPGVLAELAGALPEPTICPPHMGVCNR